MSTSATQQKVVDARWIRFRSAAYLGGRGLSWGCGNDPIVPQAAIDGGKYSLNIDVGKFKATDICDIDVSIFANNTLDHLFIGARENPPLNQLVAKLKIGGHLVIHAVPGDPTVVRDVITEFGEWQEKDVYERDGQFLGIWKLLARSRNGVLPPKPRAAKRACIARYGAIGDMIMITPLIRKLAEDGYEVTMNITPYCVDVIRNNPYVKNIIAQERDIIPNQDLGSYWNEWIPEYDKYVNLSESIEGKLLKVEGRSDFYTTKVWREETCSDNYFDNTARLGGYPNLMSQRGEMFFTRQEIKDTQYLRNRFKDKFFVMWSVKGSSHHKVYPLLEPVVTEWLSKHQDAVVALVGSKDDAKYQFDHPRVIPLCGELPIRQVFCLTQFSDLVVGPESAIINAAGCFEVPKIVFLSHSNHGNLCKYWLNDYCLQAEVACSPCHALHYSLESCPLAEIVHSETNQNIGTFPLCAANGIMPQRLIARLDEVYNTRQKP